MLTFIGVRSPRDNHIIHWLKSISFSHLFFTRKIFLLMVEDFSHQHLGPIDRFNLHMVDTNSRNSTRIAVVTIN